MMHVYSGNVTIDVGGVAAVRLPDWFETLDTDFCYQLTVIGQFAQVIVSSEIHGNRFEIKTSASNVKVSLQVSAVRQHPWAKVYPLVVEPEKEQRQRGFYLNPELYGAPEQKLIEWARHQQIMKEVQEHRQVQAARIAGRQAERVLALRPLKRPNRRREAFIRVHSVRPGLTGFAWRRLTVMLAKNGSHYRRPPSPTKCG